MNHLKTLKDRLPSRDRSSSSSSSTNSNSITGLGLRGKASSFVSSKTPSFLSSSSSNSGGDANTPVRPLTALRDPGEFAPPPKRTDSVSHRPYQHNHSPSSPDSPPSPSSTRSHHHETTPALPPRSRQRAETNITISSNLYTSSSPDLSLSTLAVRKRPPPPPPPKRMHSYSGGSRERGDSLPGPPVPGRAYTEPQVSLASPPPLPPRNPGVGVGVGIGARRGTIPTGGNFSNSVGDLRGRSSNKSGAGFTTKGDSGSPPPPTRRRPPPPPPSHTEVEASIKNLSLSGISVPELGIRREAPPKPPPPRPANSTTAYTSTPPSTSTSTRDPEKENITLQDVKTAWKVGRVANSFAKPSHPSHTPTAGSQELEKVTIQDVKTAWKVGRAVEGKIGPGVASGAHVAGGAGGGGGVKKWGVVDAGVGLLGKKAPPPPPVPPVVGGSRG